MQIINQTKNTVLAGKVTIADKPLARMIGLLGKDALRKDEALVLRPCNSIHTFFMRFAIDVLFLDAGNKVVARKVCFKPWKMSQIFWKAKSALELPCGVIDNSNTKEGDQIVIL